MKILITGSSGYIGTYLAKYLINQGHSVCGLDPNQPHSEIKNLKSVDARFEDLSTETIAQFGLVIHLAAISNVKDAGLDPIQTIHSNGIETFLLVRKCNEVSTPVIYASSGSIYSSTSGLDFTLKGSAVNAYDGSKMAADLMIAASGLNALAMCFGTLAGYSCNMRRELIFNAMNISAATTGQVSVWNGDNLRSVLFLCDLCKYIDVIIRKLKFISGFQRIQLYSWSGSINDLGGLIASYWNARLEMMVGGGTYSFVLADHDFTRIFGEQIRKTSVFEMCDEMRDNIHGLR